MKRLDKLKKFAKEYTVRNQEAIKEGAKFVSNPVNAYLLIKRLTSDWTYVESMMKNNAAEQFIQNITERRKINEIKYPDEEDLTGAAVALLRLQDTYRLDTHDLSEGIILGEKYGDAMNAHDCFEVGRASYNNKDYYHTLMWMQEALNRAEHEDPPSAAVSEILEYLAFSLYQQGNLKRALALTHRLYEIAPHHPRAKGNIKWYEDMMEEQGMKKGDREDFTHMPPVKNSRSEEANLPERDMYEALCRGEVPVSEKEIAKLYCYYKQDRPYLRLAPIKVEIQRFDPLAVKFINVINDYEISIVKQLAGPRLARATVQNAQTGDLETASYRISKSAWLKGEEHPVIERINNRIDMMTNLNQDTSEELQVANYGIGGHYDPHFDFARKEEKNAFKSLGTGSRIATVLFYMSEPEKGGATVFPELKTAAWPTLHDALFWYNLHRDGEGDMTTRHAACPVLTGVKWVSNKWIHERGQEFRRPCAFEAVYQRAIRWRFGSATTKRPAQAEEEEE